MTTVNHIPGIVAQEVSPNPKCNNCLHFQGNAGKMGACTIGLRPWLCGEGDNQVAGYSPLDKQAPTEPGDASPLGRADANVDNLQSVPLTLTVFGDEHRQMVKSIHDELDSIQKRQCTLHQNAGVMKSYSQHVGAVVCDCKRIASKSIASRLFKSLENAERVHVTEDDVLFFVRGVRNDVSTLDIALARLHAGTDNSGLNKSLYAPNKLTLGDNNHLAKSLYGEDWTTQFIGTDLFDEAEKLRTQEIEACEQELKERIERRKQAKIRDAQVKESYSDVDYETRYAAEEKLRIAKAKLLLKLQKHRNKQMKPTSKSVDDDDLKKGLRWKNGVANTKHGSYHVMPSDRVKGGFHIGYKSHKEKGPPAGISSHYDNASTAKHAASGHHATMMKRKG